MKYMIIKKSDYIEKNRFFLKKVIDNEKIVSKLCEKIDYLERSVGNLTAYVQFTLDQLKNTESARRINASKIGGLTTSLNKEKNKTKELLNTIDEQKEHYENKVSELQDNVKDLEVKLEESMSDKYVVKKLPADKGPRKRQTMKIKNCTVQSNIARKMFGNNK